MLVLGALFIRPFMCGIAGFWQSKALSEAPSDVLERMGATLAHRGPDDAGNFYDSTAGVGLAFRRLSIIDLSPEGHQPMASRSGRYTIVYNGEVYNFEEIRAELGQEPWRGHSDTEVILAAIERWGVEGAVKRFVGMFALALWDRDEQKLHLVRDRLGIKPLYYGHVGGDFVFGSELKPIAEFPGFEGKVDRNALALYMRLGYIPAPQSIYQGIYKLKPGHILSISAGAKPETRAYWSAVEVARQGMADPVQLSDEEAVAELEKKIADSVRLRMIADVPLGAFLSGGIDSSTVVALMQAQSSRPVKTFSIGFHESDYNEATHAGQVARHLGTEHTELYVTANDALDVVPRLSTMYDEPFADSSQIPTHLVSKLARQHVTVSLSGDGGDEMFGGYSHYSFIESMWRVVKKVPRSLRGASGSALRSVPAGFVNGIFKRMASGRSGQQPAQRLRTFADFVSTGTPDAIYLYAISQWRDPEAVVVGAHEPRTVFDLLAQLCWLPSAAEMAMLADLSFYLPDDILTKVDRASMTVGLEARVPLLDHRVVEFAWKLPLDLKIRDGKSKWILREVLYKHVPPALVERKKMGFGVPVDQWLRGPLREWAEDLLSPKSLKNAGYFEPAAIRQKWEEHLSGARNWEYPLWSVLMFQDWLKASGKKPSVAQLTGARAH